ncbi:uncharacterized protein yc1106_02182 [Curvularia clavata]|uniref:Uncharacterized protein n=1 Tax=Curvularia clavata TaxID=95742 RepID=A0A9Q8Z5X5_CURCL|nr:uncharacterized protein yc1106_02182 [Curvularia clavata]
MLARVNSDAAARLRRSKSSSTVHKRPTSIAEPIDLDTVRQQALAAATTAFARAQAQDAVEHHTRRSSDLSKSKSDASRKSLTTQGNHFPARGSSFRSLQAPSAEQGKGSQRKSHNSTSHTEQTAEQPSRFHITPASDESRTVPHQLSQQASFTLAKNAKPNFQQKTVRPSGASSVASQQIRKARSMYYASSIQTGSPIARPPAKYLTLTSSDGRSPGSESSSMQPPIRTLGRSPLTEPRIPVTVAPGTTLNEARDEYLHEFQKSSMKHKPSVFLAPFKKRQDKAKDKAKSSSLEMHSFSLSRNGTPIEPVLDAMLNDFMPQQELKEKRSFSGSLKHRIKKAFRRTSTKPIDLPVQHIKASRQYFDAPHSSPSSISDTTSIPCPDETTLERVRGRTSSLEKARPAYLRSEHRSDSTGSGRSARSLHSEVNAPHMPASRVTSWGTTSTSDTPTQRSIKRMTVIHECKDNIGCEAEHVSSVTASRRKSLPLPPLSSFRDPMPIYSLPEEESSPIDLKRVFSASMKEMGATKPAQESSVPVKSTSGDENSVFESSMVIVQDQSSLSSINHSIRTGIEADQRAFLRQPAVAHSVRSKTSTVKAFGKAMRSTIRAVTPAGQHLSSNPEPVTIAPPASMHGIEHRFESATIVGTEGSLGSSSTTKPQHASSPYIPSASQIAKRMEKSRDRWKAHLADPESFQFPRETDKTYDVTAFVRQTCVTPSDSTKSSKKSEPQGCRLIEEDSLNSQPSLEVPRSTYMNMPMSPSIYSRNTDGISINTNDSATSFHRPGQSGQFHNAGSAVVLTSQSVRSYVVGTPSPRRQEVAHTSRDWRAWLAHEISSMELSSCEDLAINERYGKSSQGDRSDATHVSSAENKDMMGFVQDYRDATTSPVDTNTSAAADVSPRVEDSGNASGSVNNNTSMGAAFPEEHNLFLRTPNTGDVNASGQVHNHSQPGSAPLSIRPRQISTADIHVPYHAGIDTPKHISRSGQGASIASTRCSSSNSLASRYSMSPANVMAPSKFLKSPKSTPEGICCSSLSARSTNEISQHIAATTPLKSHDTQIRRKENLTPKSLYAHNQRTPSALSSLPRPRSHQLLNPSTSNRNSPNPDQSSVAATPGIASAKSPDSPTTTPLRPRIRVLARPISPEKRAHRPKSAVNLQTTANLESPNQITDFVTASSPPRPGLYVRDTTLYNTPSTSSLSLYREPSPARPDSTAFTSEYYTRSATPGHRMADEFLKQRNSKIACEERAGRRKGSKFLVREDTPAFL